MNKLLTLLAFSALLLFPVGSQNAFAISTATGVEISNTNAQTIVMQPQQNCNILNTFNDRTAFDNAVGSTTLEDFTPSSHFPISTGILNSATNLPGINLFPGDIQPGVTYSTPIGTSFFFNIDAGGGFTGGFLDGFKDPEVEPLTVTFDNPVAAFGFDTNSLMGTSFDLTVQFTSGPDFVGNFPVTGGFEFFGFQSETSDIQSVLIHGDGNSFFDFALDNFAFGGEGCGFLVGGSLIPIDSTSLILAGAQSFSWMIPLMLSALGIGLFVLRRK